MIAEYGFFKDYSKHIKQFFLDNVYLSNYTKENNVQVSYATPSIAFAKYVIPVINGSNLNPSITFYLTNIQYGEAQNNGYKSEYMKVGNKLYSALSPLNYKLTYKCIVFANNEKEMDFLLYQIWSKAYKNRPYAKMVNGQWCDLIVENIANSSENLPGEAKDRIIRYDIDMVIWRAYLPFEAIEIPKIETVNLQMLAVKELTDVIGTEIYNETFYS